MSVNPAKKAKRCLPLYSTRSQAGAALIRRLDYLFNARFQDFVLDGDTFRTRERVG